ncbi:MAG TPA: helix-turn-helix transcriptional regulator [Pseudonocardiaceae bacterium]|jgi:transcriptional regulator with XRE-family HTH domain|nr:helix-turn-helix transcriptional regulator [Pseudonocardiaceae bacterium]
MVAIPSRRKRKLGVHLRDIRDKAGIEMSDAADVLRVSPSTVSRFETGYLRPGWAVLLTLLEAYRSSDVDRRTAVALWENAEESVARIDLPPSTPKEYRLFLRAELEATGEQVLAPGAVPGLLRTAGYAEAAHRAEHRFHDQSVRAARYVATSRRRQQRLADANPLRLHVLLDEMALRREIGGPAVLREQLEHLVAIAGQDNVTIQVITCGAGGYGAMSGGCTILDFDDDEPLGYLEHPLGGTMVADRRDVQRLTDTFADAAGLALSPADSAAFIEKVATELSGNPTPGG